VPIKKAKRAAKKVIKSLKKKVKAKKKKFICSHPLNERGWVHDNETSITTEICKICKKEFGSVALPARGKKPGIHEQRLVAEAKVKSKNPAQKRRD